MSEAAASWEALDKELLAMMDTFSNMVRASRIPDEESDQVGNVMVCKVCDQHARLSSTTAASSTHLCQRPACLRCSKVHPKTRQMYRPCFLYVSFCLVCHDRYLVVPLLCQLLAAIFYSAGDAANCHNILLSFLDLGADLTMLVFLHHI